VSLDNLDPLDRAQVAPTLEGHTDLLDALHRQHGRLYGLGGVLCLCATALLPTLVGQRVELGPLQVALVAAAALLTSLAALRLAAQSQAQRLRRRATAYFKQHNLDRAQVLRAARSVPGHWFFFCALWEGEDEQSP
jgi:hypothetical protein